MKRRAPMTLHLQQTWRHDGEADNEPQTTARATARKRLRPAKTSRRSA